MSNDIKSGIAVFSAMLSPVILALVILLWVIR